MNKHKRKIIIFITVLVVFFLWGQFNKLVRRKSSYTIIQLLWLTFSDKYYDPPYTVFGGIKTNKSRYEKMDSIMNNIYSEIVSFQDLNPSLKDFGGRNIIQGEGVQSEYSRRILYDSLPKKRHRAVYGGTKIDIYFTSGYCDSTCSYDPDPFLGAYGFDWEIFLPELDKFVKVKVSTGNANLLELLKTIIDRNIRGFKRVNYVK